MNETVRTQLLLNTHNITVALYVISDNDTFLSLFVRDYSVAAENSAEWHTPWLEEEKV